MNEEWPIYRVTFPLEDSAEGREVSMEVSAHPLRSPRTIAHQVWLLLIQWGHDVEPGTGTVEPIGTELVTND